MVEGKDLVAYYDRPEMVSRYVEERFSDPVGRLLHENQVAFLNGLVESRRIDTALEIAPGTGRITAEVRGLSRGVAMDTSAVMLAAGREALGGGAVPWELALGSAFSIPLAAVSVPMAYSFRFVRHLRGDDRARVFAEVRRVLRPRGLFLFDAPNAAVERLHRGLVDHSKFPVYDKLWTRAGLMEELEAAGFAVDSLEGSVRHFFTQTLLAKLTAGLHMTGAGETSVRALEAVKMGEPFEWLVVCESK